MSIALSLLLALAAPAAAKEVPASGAALRGVHFTGWAAGGPKTRREFAEKMAENGFNAVAVVLKDYDGHVMVKGVPLADKTGAYVNAIPDLAAVVREFKSRGIYTIARIAVFKDDHLARKRPDLAVHFPDGSIWVNDRGTAWVDPYQKEVWDYVITIAEKAVAAGFDEVQWDFIRFPSDGKTRQCRYSRADHSPATAGQALVGFLEESQRRLKPLGPKISICTFGLTTSVDTGMGIGQTLASMAKLVDFVSPMMYPSHYAPGEYGLRSPNAQPYLTIQQGVKDALARLGGDGSKLRPYLQDFSLGVRYDAAKVRAQIRAAEELGVTGWLLWNAGNKYTWDSPKAGPMHEPLPEPKPAPKPPARAPAPSAP